MGQKGKECRKEGAFLDIPTGSLVNLNFLFFSGIEISRLSSRVGWGYRNASPLSGVY